MQRFAEFINEHIVKLSNGKYRLVSHAGKNLGTFDSRASAAKHEGEVEYFKHMKEDFQQAKSDLKSEPGYLYHATNAENARSIARTGLKPFRPDYGTDQSCWPDGTCRPRIYFSKHAHVVWQFAPTEGRSVVLRVKQSATDARTEIGTGDIYASKPVPASAIEILTTDGRWIPLKNAF